MDRNQINITEMGSTVSKYMHKNQALWSSIKSISATVADVDATLAAIGDKNKEQQTPISGAGEEKNSARHDLEDQILLIADPLAALATELGDPNLEAQAHLTLAGLDKLSAEDLEATAKRISELGTANLTKLADSGITQQDLQNLDELRTEFSGVKTAPRDAVVDRKKQTDTLPDLIRNLRSILRRRLDRQMTIFKRKNPEFYAGYLAARVIVDRGGGGGSTPQPPTPPATAPK